MNSLRLNRTLDFVVVAACLQDHMYQLTEGTVTFRNSHGLARTNTHANSGRLGWATKLGYPMRVAKLFWCTESFFARRCKTCGLM